ncbi:MAG: hypothetical protein ACRENB_06675, partial [Gemmatimonadales bacterium]
GVRLAPFHPGEAARRFETLAASDSQNVEAHWRAAISRADEAELLVAKAERPRRDSLLALALAHGRRGVRLDSTSVWPSFALGLVLGNLALTKGVRDRVRLAVEIRRLALRALAADSMHDGAHHLLGRWHAEARRLSGFERLLARTLLGGGVLGEASREEARRHLARAAAIDSMRILHRLELAKVCLDQKDEACAGAELRAALSQPERFAADAGYKRRAEELLARLERR